MERGRNTPEQPPTAETYQRLGNALAARAFELLADQDQEVSNERYRRLIDTSHAAYTKAAELREPNNQ